MSTNPDLDDKLKDEARWDKQERSNLDDLDALEEMIDESDEEEAACTAEDDHGIAPEHTLTEEDIDELARIDEANTPSIIPTPTTQVPDIGEQRQTAGVRCPDVRKR